MTFDESLEWLHSTSVFGIKLGLANSRLLFEALGDPQESLKIFHVAGTNGKGSVCAMLDALLRADGHRTGLYTSPHLVDFRERIRVNGEKISPEAVGDGLTRIRAITADWDHPPTFFEITTALAVFHFAAEGCETVVLETGMGGRLDATNATSPFISVITPIAMDHRQWLGNTIAEIAQEKAGIIKPGVPVVSAAQTPQARKVLEDQASRVNAELFFITEPLGGVPMGLSGPHQKENAALALGALDLAGMTPDDATLRRALENMQWPGRFQIVDKRIVLDGAHNPHAAASLVVNWREHFGRERPVVIFAALEDKDYPVIIEKLEAIAEEFYFVPLKNSRAVETVSLRAACQIPNTIFESVQQALAASHGLTLVTGSLYLVGETMEVLGIQP